MKTIQDLNSNRIKISTDISSLSMININVGTSGLVETDLITLYFTLKINHKNEDVAYLKMNEIIKNLSEEFIYLGVKKKNIEIYNITFASENLKKKKRLISNINQEDKKFICFTDFKIVMYEFETINKLEKFLSVNKKFIENKIISYDFLPETIKNKVNELRRLADIYANNTVENWFKENRLNGILLNSKITIDDKSNIFVYVNSKEREIYSNNDIYKPINILLENTYEILG